MKKFVTFFFGYDCFELIIIVSLVLALVGFIASPLFLLIALVLAFHAPLLLVVGSLIEISRPDFYDN